METGPARIGVVYARVDLLAACKLAAVAQRGAALEGKVQSDLGDLSSCLDAMSARDLKISAELRELFLTEEVMEGFFARVPPGDSEVWKEILAEYM